MAEIKDRIVSLRNEKNITQSQLAEELNISPSAIGMYEQGRRKPSYELLEEICDYFNVDMDYLMGRSDIKNRYQAGLKYDWEENSKEEVKTAARDRKVFDKYNKLDETKRKIVEALIDSYFDENVEDEEED
jgi:transcriptional regulator